MKKTFDQWMREVDKECQNLIQLSTDEMPDVAYWDWYDSGMSPKTAAKRAIKYLKESFGM